MAGIHEDKFKLILFCEKWVLYENMFLFLRPLFCCCYCCLGMLAGEKLKIMVTEVHEFGRVYHEFLMHQTKKCGQDDGIVGGFVWFIVYSPAALIY